LPFTYQDETGVYRYSDTCGQIVVVTDIFGNEVHVPTSDGIVVVKDGRGKSVIATVDLLSTKAPTIAGDIVQEAIFSGPTTAVSVDVKPDGLPR
jgi:voltage-gated potassium channel Kch